MQKATNGATREIKQESYANANSCRGAGTRECHEYKLRKAYCLSRSEEYDARDLTDRSIEQVSRSRRVDVRGNNERSKSTHIDILCLLTLGVNIRSLCLNDLKSPAWSEKSGRWGVKSGSSSG